MKNPFVSKKAYKRRIGKCVICNEDNYDLLDVHRWKVEGTDGGKYTEDNCVCICTSCHRLCHTKKIIILGVYNSTAGNAINFLDEEGKEQFNFF